MKCCAQLSRKALEALGYIGHAEILNSGDWVPQRRHRVYMLFFRQHFASPGCMKLCFEVALATRSQYSLDSFLSLDDSIPRHQMVCRRSRKSHGKWVQRTLSFIRNQLLKPKVLALMKSALERCPQFQRLSLREQRLLACRFAMLWQQKKSLGNCSWCSMDPLITDIRSLSSSSCLQAFVHVLSHLNILS